MHIPNREMVLGYMTGSCYYVRAINLWACEQESAERMLPLSHIASRTMALLVIP
jgi:hypothetical protein